MKTNWLLLVATLSAAPAFAVNINVFKDAPVTRLSGEEVKAFRAFVIQTLDAGQDGVTAEWKAPKTRFTSKVTPVKSFEDGALKCRDTIVDSDSHDRQMRGTYTFCKGAKGDWQFKLPARPAGTRGK